jgi:hypothetical protein
LPPYKKEKYLDDNGSLNLEIVFLILMSCSFRITDLALFGEVRYDKEKKELYFEDKRSAEARKTLNYALKG